MKIIKLLLLAAISVLPAYSQTENVGIGTNNPDNSAVLHLDKQLLTSPRGLLIPRLTTAERNSIANPATGLLIFNLDSLKFQFNSGIPGAPVWASFLGAALPDGYIFVGNSNGLASAVALSGDASISNAGLVTVRGLYGRQISNVAPANGQTLVWNSTTSLWEPSSVAAGWSITGNSGLNAAVNYLGTNDAVDLVFKSNNTERLRITSSGNTGIGTSSPDASAILHLDVSADPKGLLIPKMTTAQRTSIVNPATGLMIFNTDNVLFEYNAGLPGTPIWTSFFSASLPSGNILVGNGSGIAAAVAVSGDVTLDNAGLATVVKIQGRDIDAAAPTDGQILTWNNTTSKWTPSSSSLAWLLGGNSGTTPGTDFIGTNDVQDLVFKANSTEILRLTSGGNAGIGTNSPDASAVLHLAQGATPRGLLLPTMTDTDRDLIANPANGLLIYNSANNLFEFNSGSAGTPAWKSILTTSLTDGSILIGNASNIATSVAISGDITLSNTGSVTVTKLQNNNVHNAAPTDGQVLTWDNANTRWTPASLPSNSWRLAGNSGTSPGTDFLGTTDAQDLVFKTDNTERVRLSATGSVGIGTNAPAAALDVNGTAKLGANGSVLTSIIKGTVNIDVGSIAANSYLDITATLANTQTGSTVFVSPNGDLEAGIAIGYSYISSAGNVTIRFFNHTAAAVDPAAKDFYISVIK